MTHLAAQAFSRQILGCPPTAKEFAYICEQADRWAGGSYHRTLSMAREFLSCKDKQRAAHWLARAEALSAQNDCRKLDELDMLRRVIKQMP